MGALIRGNVEIGEGTYVGPYTVIGTEAQHTHPPRTDAQITIGRRNTFRENCTVHQPIRTNATRTGDDCYFMAYTHIAHDVRIGSRVTLANATQLGGNTKILDGANFGLGVCVHQHCIIGAGAMIAMMTPVVKNVPPYSTVIQGRIRSLNKIALAELNTTESEQVEYLDCLQRGVSPSDDNPIAIAYKAYRRVIDDHYKAFPDRRRTPDYK